MTCWAFMPRQPEKRNPRRPGSQVQRRGAASIDAALSDPQAQNGLLLREGTELSDELGTFDMVGNRISFKIADQDMSLQVLENLALERVWKNFDDARGRQWSVSGMVTEYRDRNYLLIHRAVLRVHARSRPAASQ